MRLAEHFFTFSLSLFLNLFNKFNDSNRARDLKFVQSRHLDNVPSLCVRATKALTRLR